MSRSPKTTRGVTLEEFLRLPEIDEQPYQEYVDGRVEVKPLPQTKHSVMTRKLLYVTEAYAGPARLGLPFPELRCTWAGRSIAPDVVFLLDAHIETDGDGVYVNEVRRAPDIQFEIVSPERTPTRIRKKLLHSTSNGCPLGVMIDPERKAIEVHRPERPPERLPDDGILDLAPVLAGQRIPVPDIFGWLVHRRPDPPDRGAAS